jgi:tRNA pseudouridine32 synthase/23S rRNA pseudouridine746 synthase
MSGDDLGLVFRDDALLVLDKPSGLLAVQGRGANGHDCLASRVQQRFDDARVVHRLDQATSGLIVFARGAAAQRGLSMAFAERRVHKRYEALVTGLLADDDGVIDLQLAADWPNRPRQQVDRAHGKPSTTRWQVLDRDAVADLTRVALEPRTGRSHQLRVHLAALGHPILGDMLYAPQGPTCQRMMLHATELTLPHPTDGRMVNFSSPAPF